MDAQELRDMSLINMVEMYKHLYDKTDKDHKNKVVIQNTWKEIASILNLPAEECQRRWLVLRTRYNKERRNTVPSGSGASSKKEWPLYNMMKYLDCYVNPRKSFGNITEPGTSGNVQEVEVAEEQTLMELHVECNLESPLPNSAPDSVEPVISELGRQPPTKKRRSDSRSGSATPTASTSKLEETFSQTCGAFREWMSVKQNMSPILAGDKDLNLCLTLYGNLKEMKPERKKQMRKKILLLLAEIEESDEDTQL